MTGPHPVLIVDDDVALRALLAEHVADGGEFTVIEAGCIEAAEALVSAPGARFGAVILDVGLPDGDGRDFCASLRRRRFAMPVLMLTGSDDEADVVRGLEAGASDYVAKPFRAAELLARLRAQMRACETSHDAVFPLGPYTFQPGAKLLHETATRRRVRLTAKESGLLRRLHRAAGTVVPRRALLDDVWGYNAGTSTHTLETYVYRLRQKIESEPSRPRLLLAESGGYRLAASAEAGDDRPPHRAAAAGALAHAPSRLAQQGRQVSVGAVGVAG